MATELRAAILVSAVVGSAAIGVWNLWSTGASAAKIKRQVTHERVQVSLMKGSESIRRLISLFPASAAALAVFYGSRALVQEGFLLSVMMSGIGFMLPGWLREWRETRRLLLLGDQLGQMMGMVSTSLRRGTHLEPAIAEAARPITYPLGPVIKQLTDATSMGVTLAQAISRVKSLPEVGGSADFQVFASQLIICHERGVNVIQAFDSLRTVLTSRRRYRSLVREQMAQHLVQTVVISALGLLMLVYYGGSTDDGLAPLMDVWWGQVVLGASIVGNVSLIRWTHMSVLQQVRKV